MKNLFNHILFLSLAIFANAQDTIYYDADWEVTSKENQVYYRPMPLQKVGSILYLKDYYKSGALQFQGYISPEDERIYFGDVYWYEENGELSGFSQYYNQSNSKELTYNHFDGSLWKRVFYNNKGKKKKIVTYLNGKELAVGHIDDEDILSGVFTGKAPEFYYDDAVMVEDKNPVVVVPAPSIYGEYSQPEKTEKEHLFDVVIFWNNGKLAKKSTYSYKIYGNKLLSQSFYDENGKLINTIQYKNDVIETNSGKEYEYFLINDFAQSIKSEKSFNLSNPEKNVAKEFDENGELISIKSQLKDHYSKVDYYQKGKVIATNTYLYDSPFDGIFTENLGYFITTYQLINGKKEGEVKTISTEDEKLIAKGTYLNNLPNNGTFFLSDEKRSLSTYKNGKQDGLQVVYENFYDLTPEDEFQMKDGLMNGLRKQYKNGELTNESEYRNGEIYNGIVNTNQGQITYKNGILQQKITYSDNYSSQIKEIENYTNGVISKVEYYNFTINGDPQDHYIGVYKNGLPYDGFFKNQVMLDDIYLIDFYEKGKKKYQYSFDFLNQMDNYKHYILDIKSIYKNDKIFDGSEFLKPTKNGLVRLNYSSGKLNKVEVNLFAMHYFNRINFEQSKNEILINEMQSAYNVKVSTKNKQQIAQLFDDKKLISTTSPLEEVKLGTPLSKTFYYLDQEQIKTYSVKMQDFGHVDTNELVFRIFAMFPMNYSSQDEVMNHFAKIFSKEDIEESFMSDSEYIFPFKKEDLLSTLDYDDKGKIGFGIKVTREKDGKYLIEGMEDNKVLESVKVNSVEELRRDQNKIISDLMYRILNN